jgi:hypothetical protein
MLSEIHHQMSRKFTLQYTPDGNFWMREREDDDSKKGPSFGPFPREEAIFQLGRIGVQDFGQVSDLLQTALSEQHEAPFEID